MKFGMSDWLDRNHGNPLILRIRVQTVVCPSNLSMKFGMSDWLDRNHGNLLILRIRVQTMCVIYKDCV
jgi:hypothetical protein